MTDEEPTPAEIAAWEKRQVQEADARRHQEQMWAAGHPDEWKEWQRLLPLLDPLADVFAAPFDFAAFLQEVGRRPSLAHVIGRRDENQSFQRVNLVWVTPKTDVIDVKEAAAILGIGRSKVYRMMEEGELRYYSFGRRKVLDRAFLEEFRQCCASEVVVPRNEAPAQSQLNRPVQRSRRSSQQLPSSYGHGL